MKKLLIALALGLALVFALATVASADYGPHGGFNGSTEACASCHRAHQAVSTDGMLLVANDIWDLCTNCHDGTGAYTNVVTGCYDVAIPAGDAKGKGSWVGGNELTGDTDHGLFGGGFETACMLTNYGNGSNDAGGLGRANVSANSGADLNASTGSWALLNAYDTSVVALPSPRAVTSRHNVAGAPALAATARGGNVTNDTGTGAGTVWGSGNIQASAVSPFGADVTSFDGTVGKQLECTSCHDPHGNAGRWQGAGPVPPNMAPYPSYRLLKFTPSSSNGFEVSGEVGNGAANYWNTGMTYAGTVPASDGVAYAAVPVVPVTTGVQVPDRDAKWYTVNNDPAYDNTVLAYRGRGGSGEIFVANFAGQGDYMGRYYGYKRPSATLTGYTGAGTQIACWDGSSQTATSSMVATCPTTSTGTPFNNLAPHDALGFWCSTCHDRYLAPGGASRTTDSGDPGYHRRHRAAASGATTGTGTYTCVDCHNAHGTSATASALVASNASYAKGSVLLKADNRAICIRCHAGAINFFNYSTSPAAPFVLP